MFAFAIATATFAPTPIDLDRLTVDRARTLHGKPVVVTFLVTKPHDYWRGRTVVGAADRDDNAERSAHLKDKRFDIEEGARVTVRGVMRVTDWRGYYVDGRFVPPWTGIIVDER